MSGSNASFSRTLPTRRHRPVAGQRRASWSRWKRTVVMGWRTLWLHRLRSLLTMLGIVFGVCSVIAMLAIGEGASHEAHEQIRSLGSQNIIVQSVQPPEEEKVSGNQQGFVLTYGLTHDDTRAIQATIPGVEVVVPGRVVREWVWNIDRRVDCNVVGTVPWYPAMRSHPVAEGRFFTELEMEEAASVCVIGAEMVDSLFPFGGPLGQDVRVGNKFYRVIGVMAPAGASVAGLTIGTGGMKPANHRMFIPLSTGQKRFGETSVKRRSGSLEAKKVELHEVTVKVERPEQVVPVSQAVRELLERRHKKKDYEIIVPLELLRQAEKTKQIFSIVLGSIAAISLIVGGIGIMNIMLASVTERTREIGIRRALGARRADIVVQFLVETVILAGSGGLIGVALGVTIPYLVSLWSGMDAIVTVWAPVVAFTISAVVGVVFGIYPALRAAEMDPVEALRHE